MGPENLHCNKFAAVAASPGPGTTPCAHFVMWFVIPFYLEIQTLRTLMTGVGVY